jgi:hypothetical protein
MNNETEFSAATHDLLLKNGPSRIDHHTYKHMMVNILASSQVAMKKKYIILYLGSAKPNLTAKVNPF